jgi:hypothetical protein
MRKQIIMRFKRVRNKNRNKYETNSHSKVGVGHYISIIRSKNLHKT